MVVRWSKMGNPETWGDMGGFNFGHPVIARGLARFLNWALDRWYGR